MRALQVLIDQDIGSALVRNTQGNTALHCAVGKGQLAAVVTLTSKLPACAQIQCENGCLPIHDAVSVGASQPDTPQIITCLLNAFKSAIYVSNDEGLLPLHLAAAGGFEAGIRTLLASELDIISIRDDMENLLPLDIAVQVLQEHMDTDGSDSDNSGEGRNTQKHRQSLIACVEILLSSMFYKRFVSSPRTSNIKSPFMPLHSVISAEPSNQTWKVIFSLYGKVHENDLDRLGRNIAHCLCSQPVHNVALYILQDIPEHLFGQVDNFGFLPLHLCLQNNQVPFDFVAKLVDRHRGSLSFEVLPIVKNKYAHFSPAQIAAVSECGLDVILFLLQNHPDICDTSIT